MKSRLRIASLEVEASGPGSGTVVGAALAAALGVSNRFQMVDREFVDGSIEGVDFGPELLVIARSPTAVLAWERGHTWSVNGFVRYSESHMVMMPSRSKGQRMAFNYKTVGKEGGKLTRARVMECAKAIAEAMKIDFAEVAEVGDAVSFKKTLLIEGGGPPLRPARRLGNVAYQAWVKIEPRGFINPEL